VTVDELDVVVVGAGPTGLALALQATCLGATVRIVERRPEAFRPSRAIIVHPRTLEVLRPLGVSDALVERGVVAPRVDLHVGGRVVSTSLGPFPLPDTPFPYLTFAAQAVVEHELSGALAARGVAVERGVELTGLVQATGGSVVATLRRPGGSDETLTARHLAGCDGSSSTVRHLVDGAWRGGPHRHEVVLADVELDTDLAPDVGHMGLGPDGLVFLLALGEQAPWRLLATRPTDRGSVGAVPTAAVVNDLLGAGPIDATVTDVVWADRFPIEHRIASRYRAGAVFLAGDAAHTHSPAGGQGMNTGIQDGINLGWKLAFAADPSVPDAERERLLDTYESERRPVARRVLAATRGLYWVEAGTDPAARLLRTGVAGRAAPAIPTLLRRRHLVGPGVRLLSQLWVDYRDSPLSQGGHRWDPRRPGPGDRLPDLAPAGPGRAGLHELTSEPGIHLLLGPEVDPATWPALGRRTHLHRGAGWPAEGVVGVRPDGHVGYRNRSVDPGPLLRWLTSMAAPVA
jgi:2-polyprenyl-6-methoxyphenol hydroxylase-like FAD-dependent oxidoreductase